MTTRSSRSRAFGMSALVLCSALVATSATAQTPQGSPKPMHTASLERLTKVVQADIAAGRLPGAVMLIHKDGKTVLHQALGKRDPDAPDAMQPDSIFRIYSMTKPIVSVGLMMLVEDGKVQLGDPIAKYLPEFKNMSLGIEKKDASGSVTLVATPLSQIPGAREPTVHDLMRHTAGLTYGIFGKSLLKTQYLQAGVEQGRLNNTDFSKQLATLPLAYLPGSTWEYSRSTDLVGSLIERVSGQTLAAYVQARILAPLGMKDTAFWTPPEQQNRVAQPFKLDPESKQAVRLLDVTKAPVYESGGGGMVSTATDYLRFSRMLLAGGTLDGVRLLSSKTIALMTTDHLGADVLRASRVIGATTGYVPGAGYGFGLGFGVRLADGESSNAGSAGDYSWGGLGGTFFWIDPKENLIGIWMMQGPFQREYYRNLFKNLVYGAF
jgi:CubicO group peptidase (beta-lactamase class C family)